MTYNFIVPPKGDKHYQVNFLELPVIQTPLTKVTEHWMSFQKGPCASHELDFARCAARVGITSASVVCREFLEDMHECAYHYKSMERYKIMQKERAKQGREYAETPPKDSVHRFYR